MNKSDTAPVSIHAGVLGTIICPNGHNMYVERKLGTTVHAVCYTQTCTLYRVQYSVVLPVANLIKLDIQTLEGSNTQGR